MKPSDDFKLVVKYEAEISRKSMSELNDLVPTTPRSGDNMTMKLLESEIEEEDPKPQIMQVNIDRSFEQIMVLQDQVEQQFKKNKELIKFISQI